MLVKCRNAWAKCLDFPKSCRINPLLPGKAYISRGKSHIPALPRTVSAVIW